MAQKPGFQMWTEHIGINLKNNLPVRYDILTDLVLLRNYKKIHLFVGWRATICRVHYSYFSISWSYQRIS